MLWVRWPDGKGKGRGYKAQRGRGGNLALRPAFFHDESPASVEKFEVGHELAHKKDPAAVRFQKMFILGWIWEFVGIETAPLVGDLDVNVVVVELAEE